MAEKKTRKRIPQENKVRAELQKEIQSKCPFCEGVEVGHFQIHHIDENPSNNDLGNLLLLCPTCHSQVTKGDISQIDVLKKKIFLINNPTAETRLKSSNVTNFNSKVENAIVGNNNKVSVRQKKTIKQKYPEGCVGFDTVKANYIGHLIKRYNEYKEYEVGKGKVNYAIFSSHLKKRYKIGPTRTLYNLPIARFYELVDYIQSRIDSTKLAKIKGSNHRNYSTYQEYEQENTANK